MPMEEFEKELELIDTNYPFSIPTSLQLSVQIIVGLAFLAIILLGIWLYCKHRSRISGLWNLTSKVPDLLQQDLMPISQLFHTTNSRPNDIEPVIPPPILVPTTS